MSSAEKLSVESVDDVKGQLRVTLLSLEYNLKAPIDQKKPFNRVDHTVCRGLLEQVPGWSRRKDPILSHEEPAVSSEDL